MMSQRAAAQIDTTWLPDELRTVQGLTFDALQIPGTRRSAPTGVWYDAFPISAQRIVVSIGDVVGREAAATLPQRLRELFGAESDERESAALLRVADGWLRELSFAPHATALVGIIDLAASTFAYIAAGLAAPHIRYQNAMVAAFPTNARAADLTELEQPAALTTIDLQGAALLVLSTGGLLPGADADAADPHRLHAVLADERLRHCARPAAWLARRLLDDRSHDPAAVLAVVFPASALALPANEALPRWRVAWTFEATAVSSKAVRLTFLAHLQSKLVGRTAIDLTLSELIFGELLGNVVRHAPGRVEIILDWTAELPVLHVKDNGPGFHSRRRRERLPADDLSESGRGLFIINSCAVDFSVRNRRTQGTHATATLPLLTD